MKFKICNLGTIKQAEFSLGDFTIICGRNNTGKTYTTYSLFGFLSLWRDIFSFPVNDENVRELLEKGVVHIDLNEHLSAAKHILEKGCKAYATQLPKVFAAPADRFQNSKFKVELEENDLRLADKYDRRISSADAEHFSITKSEGSTELVVTLLLEKESMRVPQNVINRIVGESISDIIFGHLFPNPFIASAERTGATIFRKELNFARNRILKEMIQSENNVNPLEFLFRVYQDYALPVEKNVDFIRQLETIAKRKSFIAENHPDILTEFAAIIGGQYTVTEEDGIYFVPDGTKLKLTMGESSSAIRSLLDIGFYLRHVAKPGDLLMIDEPELNLHPENQRLVARLLARLVNIGIKVFISTHSDYIIKELNTLIMLGQESPRLEKIAKVEGYHPEEFLSADKIRVYIAEMDKLVVDGGKRRTNCQTLTLADIDPKYGIEARSFDDTIETMNRIQEEIVWGEE
ncbi:MAG: ATP-binding protein [bacterium]